MSENGGCSKLEYFIPNEQVEKNGSLMWSCRCSVCSLKIEITAFAISKRDAKRYASYLVLCKHFSLHDEYKED